MKYELSISKHNQQVHLDIEKDIQKQQGGLLTFTLRVDNGNIVDYNVVEYVDANDYVRLKSVIVEEFTFSHYPKPRGVKDPIRTDNS